MPEITVVELLKGARDRIIAGWCQNTGARTIEGTIAYIHAPEAVSYCIVGALRATRVSLAGYDETVGAREEQETQRRLLEELGQRYHPHYRKRLRLERWNDQKRRTQADVVALFEETIASLK